LVPNSTTTISSNTNNSEMLMPMGLTSFDSCE
jgi:hypothetical protein